jgi:hypothetical protein
LGLGAQHSKEMDFTHPVVGVAMLASFHFWDAASWTPTQVREQTKEAIMLEKNA